MDKPTHAWENCKQLITSLHSGHHLLILALVCTGIGILGHLGIAYMMRHAIDAMFAGETESFLHLSILFVAMILGIALTTFGERFFIGGFAEQTMATLRARLVEKINRLPVSYLDNQHSGDLISRLTNDAHLLHQFLFHQLVPLVFLPAMGVVALAYLLVISWQLTLVVIAATPLLGVAVSFVARPMGRTSEQLQQTLGEINSLVQDSIGGHQEIKAFNLQDRKEERFLQNVATSVRGGLQLAWQRSQMHGVANLASIAPFLLCFGYGGYLAIHGTITLGSFVAFINLLNNVSNPLQALPTLIGQYHTAMAGFGRIEDVLSAPEEQQGGSTFSPDHPCVVAFDHVTFAYPTGEPVLTDLSFTINKGETIAVVGPSGSGKSTLLKLVTGFYTPQSGDIKAFGHCLRQWDLAALRQNMSLVTQDTYLYPTTIASNIAYGLDGATNEQVVTAAKLGHAHDFIIHQPDGYQTIVGERGSRLSGGQKQRIAIARAILKDAELLLLDEPTSALDTESEHLVQQALQHLMQEKTTIVVAHRLSTIKNAHRILVIDAGRIVQTGTHEELLAEQGLYNQLYAGLHAPENDSTMTANAP